MAFASPSKVGSEVCDVELLKDEEGGLMMELGIATISFYSGAFKPAAEALRAQLVKVVKANPWIVGRLVKTKKGKCLRHPVDPGNADEIDAIFSAKSAGEASSFKIAPGTPCLKMCAEIYKSKTALVGSGYSLVGKDKRVTSLILAESEPGKFTLIFSMSHVVADGRTY